MWYGAKYRRAVFEKGADKRLKEILRDVAAERQAIILEVEVMKDRVHLLVDIDPQFGIYRLIKLMKGRWSRLLRREFKHSHSLADTVDEQLFRIHGGRVRQTPNDPSVQDRRSVGRHATVISQPACDFTTRSVEGGNAASFALGLTGRRTNSPPQFGQRASGRRCRTQSSQKVHSNEQIIASRASGGRSLLQHSQFGFNISISINSKKLGLYLCLGPNCTDRSRAGDCRFNASSQKLLFRYFIAGLQLRDSTLMLAR
jgi:hypothetical protein